MFTCTSGVLISTLFICDGVDDCFNSTVSTDEQDCAYITYYEQCKSISSSYACMCSPLYYTSRHGKCVMYLSQELATDSTDDDQFKYDCHNNKSEDNQNGLITNYELIFINKSTKCPLQGQLPCLFCDLMCYK